MANYYMLDKDHNVIPCGADEFIRIYQNNDERRVAKTNVIHYQVSTVFLSMDHGFPWREESRENYQPLIFETMIFNQNLEEGEFEGPHHDEQWRYHTWDEAVKGHWEAVRMLINEFLGEETETDKEVKKRAVPKKDDNFGDRKLTL